MVEGLPTLGGRWRRISDCGSGLDDPPSSPALDYEPIGSLAGTMRVKEAAVDFGASDVPLKSEELQKLGLGQFPIVIGGMVAVVNIDGVGPGVIKFTGELLADIYLGKIQSWADPAIKALNPGSRSCPTPRSPSFVAPTVPARPSTSPNYLSKVSPQWKEKVGSDLLVTVADRHRSQGQRRRRASRSSRPRIRSAMSNLRRPCRRSSASR